MIQPAFFSSQVSISVRMPKFQFMDHSDQGHWMSSAYTSSLTNIELFNASVVNFVFMAKEEPQPLADAALSKNFKK